MLAVTTSDPEKYTPRYEVPASAPAGFSLRVMAIPDAPEYRQAVTDMLLQLGKVGVWRGTDEEKQEAAWRMREMMNSFLSTNLIGMIVPLARQTLPDNMLWMDGGRYLASDYPNLYDVIPTGWKLDSWPEPEEFQLPDMDGAFIMGATTFGLTRVEGSNTRVLTSDQLPAHVHTIDEHSHPDRRALTNVAVTVGTGAPVTVAGPESWTPTGTTALITNETGEGEPIDITPRHIGLRYAIFAG